jgi:hypothetical protein
MGIRMCVEFASFIPHNQDRWHKVTGTQRIYSRMDTAALNLRRRIASDLVDFFGEEVIRRLLGGTRPGWESDLRLTRVRHLCHAASGQETPRQRH